MEIPGWLLIITVFAVLSAILSSIYAIILYNRIKEIIQNVQDELGEEDVNW